MHLVHNSPCVSTRRVVWLRSYWLKLWLLDFEWDLGCFCLPTYLLEGL